MPGIDFPALRAAIPIARVLELLDFIVVERSGEQVRGGCPIHGASGPKSRSFSANLHKNTYRCFKCGSQGNQLDLWAAATGHSLHEAATGLCAKLQLPVPYLPPRSAKPNC